MYKSYHNISNILRKCSQAGQQRKGWSQVVMDSDTKLPRSIIFWISIKIAEKSARKVVTFSLFFCNISFHTSLHSQQRVLKATAERVVSGGNGQWHKAPTEYNFMNFNWNCKEKRKGRRDFLSLFCNISFHTYLYSQQRVLRATADR